jgi:cell division protein FtsA
MTGNVVRFGLTPKMKPVSPTRPAVVAALDIGTSKIVSLIARLEPQPPQDALGRRSHRVRILGFAHTAASGVKGGAVVDLAEAERNVRNAIDIAEQSAQLQLESVIVSLSGGRLSSDRFISEVELSGQPVSDSHIARVLAAASRQSVRDGRAILHSLPRGYRLDAARGIREPRGMLGQSFGVDTHMVTADVATVRNLMLTIERSHLAVEAMVTSPYAAGLSALADDETNLGAAVIDLGAGTTSISVFLGSHFVHADGFALGGNHVTMDLARGLNTGIANAERIKAIYGSVLSAGSDEREMITIPPVGDDKREAQFVSRAALIRIIKPRVEEILEMVRDRLKQSPFATEPGGHVVLTGGASQLAGIVDLASKILNRSVRIGRPLGFSGMPESAKGPAFAVAAGLLVYPQVAHLEHFESWRTTKLMTGTHGYMVRIGQWLRESF